MADTYPPDFDSPVGLVRSLISDVNQFDYDMNGVRRYRMSDLELAGFVAVAGEGRVYAASAHALRSLAANEILVGKVIKTEDLQTDGAKVGDALRLLAREMDGRQKAEDDDLAFTENAFEIVNTGYPYHNLEW